MSVPESVDRQIRLRNLRRLPDVLGVAVEVVRAMFADPSEVGGEDATNRRDALKLGALATLAPGALTAVLGDAAADAASFTRRASATAIGRPELDHLKAAMADVSAAYSTSSPNDLFPVARAYRQRVVHSVLTRAGDLVATMDERYPGLPATTTVREHVHAATATADQESET